MKKILKKGLFLLSILSVVVISNMALPDKASATVIIHNDNAVDCSTVVAKGNTYNVMVNNGMVFIPVNAVIDTEISEDGVVTISKDGNTCTFIKNQNYCTYNNQIKYLGYECFNYFGYYIGSSCYSYDGYTSKPSNTYRSFYDPYEKIMYVPLHILIDMGYQFDKTNGILTLV